VELICYEPIETQFLADKKDKRRTSRTITQVKNNYNTIANNICNKFDSKKMLIQINQMNQQNLNGQNSLENSRKILQNLELLESCNANNNNNAINLNNGNNERNSISQTNTVNSFNNVALPIIPRDSTNALDYANTTASAVNIPLQGVSRERKLKVQKLYFIKNSEDYYVDDKKIEAFMRVVDRTSEITKINALLLFYRQFMIETDFYIDFKENHKYLSKCINLQYYYVDLGSFIFILILNIFELAFLTSSNMIPSIYDDKLLTIYRVMNAVNIIWNSLFFVIYSLTNQQLLSKIRNANKSEKERELEAHKLEKHPFLQIITMLFKDITFFIVDREKQTMLFNIVAGVITIISPLKTSLITSIQLLSYLRFVKGPDILYHDFYYRFMDLTKLIFLIAIVTYLFANIGFFFMNSEMILNINQAGRGQENQCNNLLDCFITFFNIGIRVSGGIGSALQSFSFNDPGDYAGRWFWELLSFIIVNILLGNMINAIIITAFGVIRKLKEVKKFDKQNICFICSLEKSVLEQKLGGSFKDHTENSHEVKSYIEFFIYLKNKREEDLDEDETYIRQKIDNKEISCFPIKTCLDNNGEAINLD